MGSHSCDVVTGSGTRRFTEAGSRKWIERMNELASRPSPAAERMRLHRERRRNGMRPLWIELRVTEIDALVRTGLLKPETRNDPNAIRKALYEYLDQRLGRAA
jgi:hypothetical protein